MLYPYAEFPGYLIITFSQVIDDPKVKGGKKVLVNFEQPDDNGGFKEARYSLPDYKMLYNDGFLPKEKAKNEDIMKKNAHLIMHYAKMGGVKLA